MPRAAALPAAGRVQRRRRRRARLGRRCRGGRARLPVRVQAARRGEGHARRFRVVDERAARGQAESGAVGRCVQRAETRRVGRGQEAGANFVAVLCPFQCDSPQCARAYILKQVAGNALF